MNENTYEINGIVYRQRPLVLGQLAALGELLEAVTIRELTVQGIIQAFGDRLADAMAVVLVPQGQKVRDRDLNALARELDEHMTIETALEVVADFLHFNPISSLFERIRAITARINTALPEPKPEEEGRQKENPTPKEDDQPHESSSESCANSPAET